MAEASRGTISIIALWPSFTVYYVVSELIDEDEEIEEEKSILVLKEVFPKFIPCKRKVSVTTVCVCVSLCSIGFMGIECLYRTEILTKIHM